MSLTLFGAPLSPFVRKARLYLGQRNMDYQLEMVMPFGQPAWYYDISPLGRIPALKDGDLDLADSSVICQYLEEHYPGAELYGSTAAERARVRWLEKYANYELAPLTTFVIFRNRILKPMSGGTPDEAAISATLIEKLPKHFDYLERTLGDTLFFLGDKLSVADFAFFSQIINMEHGKEALDAQRWPKLHALVERIKALPFVQGILAGEVKILAKLRGEA
ncbi:glutathione S-transferase family protein [Atopomonas sediminilitoris]|uniref:glutathione S-transferase family protein n=1 Tax=Atopomonas sediminilitoris TaxID=2919919 RepID=UPI001F4EF1C1|nr:glutathione S-transferase family protein [Atopomonas sediminilitoris]MCJ8168065.1 glutathione S-transferase family protein [Atopomonas sediminilitoris]